MKITKSVMIATCSIVMAGMIGSAMARPKHKGKEHFARASSHSVVASSHALPVANNNLVATARKYIGTNPTGMKRLWCGAFMDLVLRENGHKGGSKAALDYLRYGKRVAGPQVGAIAVLSRRGGGHVGVVSGVDPNGNPIIISGNHRRTTAEAVYPRSRVQGYVVPEG